MTEIKKNPVEISNIQPSLAVFYNKKKKITLVKKITIYDFP